MKYFQGSNIQKLGIMNFSLNVEKKNLKGAFWIFGLLCHNAFFYLSLFFRPHVVMDNPASTTFDPPCFEKSRPPPSLFSLFKIKPFSSSFSLSLFQIIYFNFKKTNSCLF